MVECNVELLSVTWLNAVDGEKHDVSDSVDCSDSHSWMLRLLDFSLVRSNVASGLIEIIARAIEVPRLGRRWKRPGEGDDEPAALILAQIWQLIKRHSIWLTLSNNPCLTFALNSGDRLVISRLSDRKQCLSLFIIGSILSNRFYLDSTYFFWSIQRRYCLWRTTVACRRRSKFFRWI